MAAGIRYRGARHAMAAAVVAGVIAGTAYFVGRAPAKGSEAEARTESVAGVVTGPAPASIRQSPALPAPAKRSRGS